ARYPAPIPSEDASGRFGAAPQRAAPAPHGGKKNGVGAKASAEAAAPAASIAEAAAGAARDLANAAAAPSAGASRAAATPNVVPPTGGRGGLFFLALLGVVGALAFVAMK